MIAFIASIAHPIHCRSYERVGELLDRTLRSICRQTDPRFVVLIACQRKPPISIEDPRIHFLEVPFPAVREGPLQLADVPFDKGTKYAAGLLYAKRFHPDHVMFFDGDDLVSREIAAFANARPAADGWFVNHGYVHWEGSGRVTPVEGFHRICGTSNVVAFRLVDLSARLAADATPKEIFDELGDFHVNRILGSHRFIADHFNSQGQSIEALPFRGAVWLRGTGENVWPSRGFPSIAGMKITPRIRDEFLLEARDQGVFHELAASYRQTLPVWREALRSGGLKGAIAETFWNGPRRAVQTLRGKEWKS